MKKAFDQNVSRAKPRLKLGAPSVDPVSSEARGPEEDWVYEVAAQVAGQSTAAEAPAPTAREVLAAAALASAQEAAEAEAEEASRRSRVSKRWGCRLTFRDSGTTDRFASRTVCGSARGRNMSRTWASPMGFCRA